MQEIVAKNGWELTKVARIGSSPSLYGQKRVMRGGVGQSHEPKLSVCCLYTSAHPFLAKNRPGAPVFGYCPFFFLGKPRKKRLASLARLMINRLSTGTSTGSECRSEKEKTPPRQAHQPRWQRYYWWTADVQVVGICHSSSLVSFVVHLQGWSEHPVSALMWVV